MSRNSYVRLSPHKPRIYGSADTSDSLAFLDVAPGGRLTDIRWLPADKLRMISHLLVRGNAEELDEARTTVEALGWRVDVGRLVQPLGAEPSIEGGDQWTREHIARARAVELAALLTWGNAVWSPRAYHYVLPSGRHIGSFVRLGDAFQEPRDADVLASWFSPDLTDQTGIIIDSGTLTPLATALHNQMLRGGLKTGRVEVLDNYPRTELDARAAIDAANTSGRVVSIVSVSSSGRLRDRIVRAVEYAKRTGAVTDARVHVLVDAGAPVPPIPEIETWLPYDSIQSFAQRSVNANECSTCRDQGRNATVTIEARSFQGMLPSQIKRLMPHTEAAHLSRPFWEMCDATSAIGIQEKPEEATHLFRAPGLMAIRIRFEHLLGLPDFATMVAGTLSDDEASADLVLVPAAEAQLTGYDAFYTALQAERVLGDRVVCPLGEWDKELCDLVAAAPNILVFALGSVSGSSLQRALVSVQRARTAVAVTHPPPRGVVVHARPALKREWDTLVNSYGRKPDRLRALWFTYLPDRSPFEEERRTLAPLEPDSLTTGAAALRERRLRLCQGVYSIEEEPLFWGSLGDDQVTPNSIFGQRVKAPAVFCAVGSALETSRAAEGRPLLPELRQFEMRAIIRSYYDPLILAAVFRWLQPGEADWGDEWGYGGEAVVGELLNRAQHVGGNDHLRVLVPELLLAAALGKLDASGAEHAAVRAKTILGSSSDETTRAPLELGLAAAEAGIALTQTAD